MENAPGRPKKFNTLTQSSVFRVGNGCNLSFRRPPPSDKGLEAVTPPTEGQVRGLPTPGANVMHPSPAPAFRTDRLSESPTRSGPKQDGGATSPLAWPTLAAWRVSRARLPQRWSTNAFYIFPSHFLHSRSPKDTAQKCLMGRERCSVVVILSKLTTLT